MFELLPNSAVAETTARIFYSLIVHLQFTCVIVLRIFFQLFIMIIKVQYERANDLPPDR